MPPVNSDITKNYPNIYASAECFRDCPKLQGVMSDETQDIAACERQRPPLILPGTRCGIIMIPVNENSRRADEA